MTRENLNYIMPRVFSAIWKHPRCFQGVTGMYLSVLFIDYPRGREIKILVVQKPYRDLIINYFETLHELL
jgi:hypothetical protein